MGDTTRDSDSDGLCDCSSVCVRGVAEMLSDDVHDTDRERLLVRSFEKDALAGERVRSSLALSLTLEAGDADTAVGLTLSDTEAESSRDGLSVVSSDSDALREGALECDEERVPLDEVDLDTEPLRESETVCDCGNDSDAVGPSRDTLGVEVEAAKRTHGR